MVRDQLPVRRRERGDLRPDCSVESGKPREVRVAGRLEHGLLRGGGGLERGDDPLHVQRRVRHVQPEVRVDGSRASDAGEVRHAGLVRSQLHERARGSFRLGQERLQPVIHAQAVHHDQVGPRDRPDVRRSGLVGVGIAAGRDEARDPHRRAARLAHKVRENRRRRDDGEGIRSRRRCGGPDRRSGRAGAATGDDDRRQGDDRDAGEPTPCATARQAALPAVQAGRTCAHQAGTDATWQSGQSPNSSRRCTSIR